MSHEVSLSKHLIAEFARQHYGCLATNSGLKKKKMFIYMASQHHYYYSSTSPSLQWDYIIRQILTASSLKDTLFLRPAFLGLAPVLRALPLLLVLPDEALESLEDLLMGVLLLEEDDEEDEEEFVTVRGEAGGRRELLRDLGESESSESLLSEELSCWQRRGKEVSAISTSA